MQSGLQMIGSRTMFRHTFVSKGNNAKEKVGYFFACFHPRFSGTNSKAEPLRHDKCHMV